MQTLFKKSFIKDLKKIPPIHRKKIEAFVFVEAPNTETLDAISSIVSITNFPNYYRKRFGDYRVGFHHEDKVLTFYRALYRKDIYKKFP